MSAECRVEALPRSGGDITVEGLRLRLDIRIVPRSRDDAVGTDPDALFRVVTAKISRASEMPAYPWAAVMVGMGVLLVAITLWIARPGNAPVMPDTSESATAAPVVSESRARAEPVEPESVAPARPGPASPAASSTPAAARAPIEVPSTLPSTATSAVPSAPPNPRIRRVEVKSRQPLERPRPSRKAAVPTRTTLAATPAPPPAAAAQPVARTPAASDMLDLFGDIK